LSESFPAAANEVVSVYVTGLGAVSPAISAAQPGGDDGAAGPRNSTVERVEVRLGGTPAEVVFSGLAPGEFGLYRIDFKTPPLKAADPVALVVRIGEVESQAGVVVNAGPEFLPAVSGLIGTEGGTLEGMGVSLAVLAGAFPRPANVQISGSTVGQVAFSVAGVPSSARGSLTFGFDRPAGARGLDGYVIVRDPDGGEMLLKPSVRDNRVTVAIPAGAAATQAGLAKRPLADAPDIDTILLILYVEGLSVSSVNGRFEVFVPPASIGQSAEAALAAAARLAEAFEVADAAVIAKSGRPLPSGFYPVPVHVVKRSGPVKGEYHGEIRLSRYNGRQVIHFFDARELDSTTERDVPFWRYSAAHLMTHFTFNAYFTPSVARTLDSQDPWLWFEEALAVWLEREVGGDSILGGPARLPDSNFMQTLMAASGEGFFTLTPQFSDVLRNTVFPSPAGLAWPGKRPVALDSRPSYARYYGQMASMFVDHLDAKLEKSHPQWLGELIDARRYNVGDASLEPVRFLRDVFFPLAGLDLNVFWIDFCKAYSLGSMYADNAEESTRVLKSLLMTFGGVPGTRAMDGLASGVRAGEVEMGDYGALMFYIPEDDKRTKFGRVSVAARSTTGALAHISSCREPPFCYFQVFPDSEFREVAAMVADELRPKTWYPAMVIQPASATPDAMREKVKYRVESDVSLSTARMAKSRRLYCSLSASMECTTSTCTGAIGMNSWLPEGSFMNCPGGVCQIQYIPKSDESHLGYAKFAPGTIEELKFVSTIPFTGGKIVNGFTVKNLPIERLFGSTEDGDWDAATFRIRGPDVGKYVSDVHFKYTDKSGLPTTLKSISYQANAELTCGLDLIPIRID
jgi:hypothetical protein